jgi:hypothetical protein
MLRNGKVFRVFMKDESGNILILVAFMMVVLLGASVLAVDTGSLYQTRRQTVNAADAAALAGAQEIIRAHQAGITDDAGVRSAVNGIVTSYLGYHEAKLVKVTDQDDNPIRANSKTVKVVAEKEAELFFVPAFYALAGAQSTGSDVGAKATAMLTPMNKPTHVAPFAIHQDAFPVEDEGDLVFSFSPGSEDPSNPWGAGNWGIVNFEGTGSNQDKIGDWIEDGYDGGVSVDSTIWAAPSTGISNKNTLDAIKYHIDEGTHLIVPVITGSTNGTGAVTVVGFSVIKLILPYPSPGKNIIIRFEFIERDFDIDLMPGGGALDFGLESASLIE